MELSRDFRDLLALLIAHQVQFLIVGGYAMAVHAVPRYTKDLDIWIAPTPENASAMVRVLAEFGLGGLGLGEGDFTDPDVVIQLGYEPNRVDFMTRIDGIEFVEAYPRRVMRAFAGLELPVIDRDSLIKNKRAAGRARDLADAEELQAQ